MHSEADPIRKVWGRFEPKARFNFDEVGFAVGVNTKLTWTLPEERASGHISMKATHESRMATMCLTTCGDPTIKVPPGLIFKGKGKIAAPYTFHDRRNHRRVTGVSRHGFTDPMFYPLEWGPPGLGEK